MGLLIIIIKSEGRIPIPCSDATQKTVDAKETTIGEIEKGKRKIS